MAVRPSTVDGEFLVGRITVVTVAEVGELLAHARHDYVGGHPFLNEAASLFRDEPFFELSRSARRFTLYVSEAVWMSEKSRL